MTVSSTPRRAGPFQTDGATTDFPFEFKVFAASDLVVTEYFSDGSYSTLQLDTDYSVELNPDQDDDAGGTVVTVDTHDDSDILITTDLEIEQATVFTNSGGFFPRQLNNNLDRLTMLIQQQQLEIDRSFRVSPLEEDITPLNATAAERANKYVVFDATGRVMGYSNGTGADSGLREDLAEDGNDLVRVNYPGFGGIVSTLGDFLPTVAASTFFGITSNGSTDDTDAWNTALEAMENSTNPNGRTIYNEPGQPSLISGEIVIRPGVELDLRGGSIVAQLTGGNDAAVRQMSRSTIRGGAIAVTSTTPGGSQIGVHAPLILGALLGEGGTTAAPHDYVTVEDARGFDLRLSSTRTGAAGVVVSGDVSGCEYRGLTVPDSAVMAGIVTLDWGIVGTTTYMGDTVQGIWSDPARMELNRAAYNAWVADNATGAYTTHPYNNRFSGGRAGSLTRAFSGIDTGSYLVRCSGGHGNVFEDFIGKLVTEAAYIHHAGDLGYEYARPVDRAKALLGNRFENFDAQNCYRGHLARVDSYADNVGTAVTTDQLNSAGALTGVDYTPTQSAYYLTDVYSKSIRGYTGEGNNALEGFYVVGLTGGTFEDCAGYGFKNNWRFTDSHNVEVARLRSRQARQHGVLVQDGSTRIRFTDTKEAALSGQQTANTYSDLYIEEGDFIEIDGGTYGIDSNAPSQMHALATANSADGVTNLTLRGTIRAMSNGAANAAVKIGGDDDDQTLVWEFGASFVYGANVTVKYDGLLTRPVRRRGGSLMLTEWTTQFANTLANYTVYDGDRFWIEDNAGGQVAVRVAITDGTIDGSGSNRDTLLKTLTLGA